MNPLVFSPSVILPRKENSRTVMMSLAWTPCAGTYPLYLCYQGKGKLDILDFSF